MVGICICKTETMVRGLKFYGVGFVNISADWISCFKFQPKKLVIGITYLTHLEAGHSFQPEDELKKNSKYCTRYLFPRISGNESIRINLCVILLEVIRWPWILDYLRQSHHESPGRV